MAKLSAAAWMVHDVGLATSIGGTLFGREALQPALREGGMGEIERYRIEDAAWRRFSWINLIAHGVVAATWFAGRSMLTGREVSRTSRKLTLAKDLLVIGSLVTGVTSVILGRVIGKRIRHVENLALQSQPIEDSRRIERMRKLVGVVGMTNLLTNAAIGAVTNALSMEASHSLPFSYVSRRLP